MIERDKYRLVYSSVAYATSSPSLEKLRRLLVRRRSFEETPDARTASDPLVVRGVERPFLYKGFFSAVWLDTCWSATPPIGCGVHGLASCVQHEHGTAWCYPEYM